MTTLTTYRNKPAGVFNEMDRIIESYFVGNSSPKTGRYPAVDVVEKEKTFGLSIELPGYSKDDVEIKIDNNLLTISAIEEEKKEEKQEQEQEQEQLRYVIRERNSRSFTRTFVLPREVDKDNIDASFENGLLSLSIPKVPKAVPKKINIKAK
ncbi:MAG: Hsp20/alpha crystallin family protein [Spirochaetales bacterium]|nr:Hsp20/alpha crystallin family protein [Spirochaetales bacterium]